LEVGTAKQQISKHQPISTNKLRKSPGKVTYSPHSDGGFHADKSISDLALGRQFLTTKYFVVK